MAAPRHLFTGRNAFRPAFEALGERVMPAVTFGTTTTFAVGAGPAASVLQDLNGDGRLDLVIVNSTDGTVSVALNTTPVGSTTPTFAAPLTFAVGSSPFGIAVADIAGNGRPDLIVTNFNSNTISVLMNTIAPGATTASFLPQQTFATGNHPQGIAVGDFNADGKPDIVVTNAGDKTVSVFTNTTPTGILTASFAAPQTFAVGDTPVYAVVADFNGDGRPDIAVANNIDNNVSVLANATAVLAPNATFFAQQTFAVGSGPVSLAVADFNGDGRPDLVSANAGAIGGPTITTVSVLLNTSAPAGLTHPVSFAAQQTFTVGSTPQVVVAGDLDGDGRPDIATTNLDSNSISMLSNTTAVGATTASFAAQQTFAAGTNPIPLSIGDVTGDGRLDLASGSNASNTASVMPNSTSPVTTTYPFVVGQFGTSGVQTFNRVTNTFAVSTGANATILAANNQGEIVGEFPGFGVWLFQPSVGWTMINGIDAVALAIDPLGDVVASFNKFGVGLFSPSRGPTNWLVLSPGTASLLAMDALGDVAAVFPTRGTFEFTPSGGFLLINGVDATALAMNDKGLIAASFPGFGIGLFLPGAGWRGINGSTATSLAIDTFGDVAAQITGTGVEKFTFSTGTFSVVPGAPATNASTVGMDYLGNIFADFPSNGVWEFDPSRGWVQLTPTIASLLAVAQYPPTF